MFCSATFPFSLQVKRKAVLCMYVSDLHHFPFSPEAAWVEAIQSKMLWKDIFLNFVNNKQVKSQACLLDRYGSKIKDTLRLQCCPVGRFLL